MDYNRKKALELYSEGHEKYDPKNTPVAAKLFALAFAHDPTLGCAYRSLAEILFGVHLFEPALRYAKMAVEYSPDDEKSWYILNLAASSLLHTIKEDKQVFQRINKEIYGYKFEGFIQQRKKIVPLQIGDVLIRVMKEKKYIENMLNLGEMFFSPASKFREMDEMDPRYDPDENKPIEEVLIPKETKISIGSGVLGPVTFQIGGLEHICCFTRVSKKNIHEFMCKYKWNELGNYAIVIKDIAAFDQQIKSALATKGKLGVQMGNVTYVHDRAIDEFPNAVFDPYVKRLKHDWQFEYRFSYGNSGNSETIEVGSLLPIAETFETEDLKKWVAKAFEYKQDQ